MANQPVKKFSFGKCNCAVFENEYKGKKTYSLKFTKSYKKDDNEWVNTDNFFMTDVRDLYILIGKILSNAVRETIPERKSEPPPASRPEEREVENEDYGDLPF